MKDDKLFRPIALERLSSPENLDQVMRVVPAKSWIALVCLFVLLAAALAWAFFGEITRQSEFQGVLFEESATADLEVLAVPDAGTEGLFQAGMRVEILLDSGGTLYGTLVSAENTAAQTEDPDALSLAKSMLPDLAFDEQTSLIFVLLDASSPISVAEPARCTVRVILERFHPVRLILPE